MVTPSAKRDSTFCAQCLQPTLQQIFRRRKGVHLVVMLTVILFFSLATPPDYSISTIPSTLVRGENTTVDVFSGPSYRPTLEPPGQQPNVLRASDLPDASNWTASEATPYEVCFVTAVYSSSTKAADRPPDVRDIRDDNPTFRLFAFTNLPDLDAPGWTIIVKNYTQYRRYITQSRWAKFLGWKDPSVHGCQAVFYMDGFCGPKGKHSERYKRLAKAINESRLGLFQNQHDVARGPLEELERIVERNKDIAKNVQASKEWLLDQLDFRPNGTMLYANHYIGYDPKNPTFQEASEFFWDHYSLEQDSWRDQPLWSYVLDKFHIVPTRLGTFDALFKEHYKRMGHAGHRYNGKADNNAIATN